MSSFLKVSRSEQARSGGGREFQRVGAAIEKALSPQVRSLVLQGRDRRLESEERRERDGEWWWSRSVRYEGARLWSALNVVRRSLNEMR